MGVPKFYRWISERFPQINQLLSDSTLLPEFDNLYLDMNGIIHACTHPNDEDMSKTLTQRQMILGIFGYIDRIVTEIVKPRKVLFMAIDGVAPRAKLNQQRARRFRAAQDRAEAVLKAKQKGEVIDEETMFDSNCITPGTEFMDTVGKHIRWFIRKKMKEDPIWRNLEVVFSGHDVPGEGEHKIMQYIREARACPEYEPNLRHCMYGQDADLIMLGLASHEPHFALLREVINFGGRGPRTSKQTVIRQTKEAQFQLLHLSILREYIELEFGLGVEHPVDKERLIDDFILLTFLVGNDFLPHLPTLDIGEHAFDVIFTAYKELLEKSPGYLVHNGEIGDLARFEQLCRKIGVQEGEILRSREEEGIEFVGKRQRRRPGAGEGPALTVEDLEEKEEALQQAYEAALREALCASSAVDEEGEGEEEGGADSADLLDALARARIREVDEAVDEGKGGEEDFVTVSKRSKEVGKAAHVSMARGVRDLSGNGVDGIDVATHSTHFSAAKDYRGRYYFEKFKRVVSLPTCKPFMDTLIYKYLEGLMWCLAYYIRGCISWTWYFPYHYGPMLQDMVDLPTVASKIVFELGQPFKPFQQLLGCLPPASKAILPRPYQWIMVSDASPVKEFYPLDFGIDMDGKKAPWEAVILLDFIDEKRLLAAEEEHCKESQLTSEERARNSFGHVLEHRFEPTANETYFSCNPEIGLADVLNCQTRVTLSIPSLSPGASFTAELISGTKWPLAGFPTLTKIEWDNVKTDFAKVNVFGSDSKYRTMLFELHPTDCSGMSEQAFKALLGKSVFVNYPQLHEAIVVAISTETQEYRAVINAKGTREIVHIVYDTVTSSKWKVDAVAETEKYAKGRGVPGTGGLLIGDISVRVRVCPLQVSEWRGFDWEGEGMESLSLARIVHSQSIP